MREEKISVNSLKTNSKIGGKGETILILHGWNGSSDSWKRVIEILEGSFNVVCPDLPGFGKSDFPPSSWSLKNFAKWLFNFAQKLKLDNFHLLGHSFGGRVALKFSILYPEKVKKLILVNSAGIKTEFTLRQKVLFKIAQIGNAIFSEKIFERFKNRASNVFYKIFRIRDYAKAKGVMKETMKIILSEDFLPELPKIDKETIIIWGKEDKILPLKYAFIFKENIKNSKLEVLPGIGHSPHLEYPEKLAEILIKNLL
jgi:pimeloyl-ACP methyl ester carboxylesterase